MQSQQEKPTFYHPGEKLKRYGCDRLSDNELLSIVIGDSTNEDDFQENNNLSHSLLSHFGDLRRLGQASVTELANVASLGYIKAGRIKAAMELGRRPLTLRDPTRIEFSSPEILYRFYSPVFADLSRETFIAVLLDQKLNWISDIKLAEGSLFSCQVNPRDAFSYIVRDNPAAVVFIHNHPTGDPEPSEADRELTQALCNVGDFLRIRVEDHLIIGQGCYYSFAEKAEIKVTKEKSKEFKLMEKTSTAKPEVMPDLCCIHDFPFFGEEE